MRFHEFDHVTGSSLSGGILILLGYDALLALRQRRGLCGLWWWGSFGALGLRFSGGDVLPSLLVLDTILFIILRIKLFNLLVEQLCFHNILFILIFSNEILQLHV